jgi:metal-responsive CopG/Arc/MetJ family transcriptional regulator
MYKKAISLMLTESNIKKIDEYREGRDLSRSYVVRQVLNSYFCGKKEAEQNENKKSEK